MAFGFQKIPCSLVLVKTELWPFSFSRLLIVFLPILHYLQCEVVCNLLSTIIEVIILKGSILGDTEVSIYIHLTG